MTPPANLPADAIGYIVVRPDRPERLAFYLADGRLNASFARDQGIDDVRAIMKTHGCIVDAEGVVR